MRYYFLIFTSAIFLAAYFSHSDATPNEPEKQPLITQQDVAKSPEDIQLLGVIHTELNKLNWPNPPAVALNIQDGVVQIMGAVNSITDAYNLVMIINAIPNVASIDVNNLMIKNNKLTNDQIITAKIYGLFEREKLSEDSNIIKPIEVYAKNGIVILIGIVQNRTQLVKVMNLVKKVDGVKSIDPKIIVINSRS